MDNPIPRVLPVTSARWFMVPTGHRIPPVPTVSIIGAGPIGASIAHRLVQRTRVPSIRLIDSSANLAAGKALDIQQAGPLERFDVPITTGDNELAAVSSPVIVVADDSANGVWDGEPGLALVQRMVRAGTSATFVFAASSHVWLMEKSYRELDIAADRLVGTAPSAVVGAVRALAGLELGVASVQLTVAGRPPALVIGWSSATADGILMTHRVGAHQLFALSRALPKLWPPAPYAIASATAQVIEGLVCGARRLLPALTIIDGELGVRGTAVMLPLELGRGRVIGHVMPSLSAQEMTEMTGGLS
jgi:malate dehydrogenase